MHLNIFYFTTYLLSGAQQHINLFVNLGHIGDLHFVEYHST